MKRWIPLTAALVLTSTLAVSPAWAQPPASAACTEAGVAWRVDFDRFGTVFGPAVAVTGLSRNGADASGQIWELRYDRPPGDYPSASPPPTWPASYPPSFTLVRGTLADVRRTVAEYLSPRLVTPDGGCTVYLSPFPAGSTRKVAVLGDDLVHQLNSKEYNQNWLEGYVEGNAHGVGIRTEVEGHTGAGWTNGAGPLDELRGLAEHDLDGAVVALGVHDALYIAAGATAPERDRRRGEVYTRLQVVFGEVSSRVGCLQVVTAPENVSSLDPEYAAEAVQVNNFFRWVITAGGTEDAIELVDFGAQARTHPQWFGPDGVHLSPVGTLVYTATLVKAAQRCAESVVLWGRPGTLDTGVLAGRTQVGSGHAFTTRAVDAWNVDPGKAHWFSTVAADGTIFMMTVAADREIFDPGGEGMTIPAFHPDHRTYTNIKIKTDRNKVVARTPTGDPVGFDIGDIDAFPDGNAVAFTGSMLGPGGQDPATEGQYPIFGILTKAANGPWRVAEGADANGDGLPDWRNSWSSRELVDATVAADPVRGRALADQVCPDGDGAGPQPPHCYWFNELAILPRSGDVAIAQYSNKTAVLKLDGPDSSGRYTLRIAGVHALPEIDDPSWDDPQYKVGVAWREVQADPTGVLGDERFALQPDMSAHRYTSDGTIAGRTISGPVLEYSYDATTGAVSPSSPPVLSGELSGDTEPVTGLKATVGMGPLHYDHLGNLWVVWGGLGIKVFAKTGAGRKISRTPCLEPGTPIQNYVARPAGGRAAWGKICPADYHIQGAGTVGPVFNFLEDPVTHHIVIGSWPGANSIVVDPEGSGDAMTFRVGNPAVLHAQGVTTRKVDAPCPTPTEPAKRCLFGPALQAMVGPIDASGRLWFVVEQEKPGSAPPHPEHQSKPYDQWMFSVDLSRLMGREPQRLTAQAGQSTVVHAEQTVTRTTTQVTGNPAVKDVISDADLRPCAWPVACTDPVSGLSGGWALGDPATGIAPSGFAEYRIVVPKGGTYRLTYRAADRAVTGAGRIRLTVNGAAAPETTVSGPAMQDIAGPTLTLAAGTHTIRMSAAPGAHGWQLDWIRFARQ